MHCSCWLFNCTALGHPAAPLCLYIGLSRLRPDYYTRLGTVELCSCWAVATSTRRALYNSTHEQLGQLHLTRRLHPISTSQPVAQARPPCLLWRREFLLRIFLFQKIIRFILRRSIFSFLPTLRMDVEMSFSYVLWPNERRWTTWEISMANNNQV